MNKRTLPALAVVVANAAALKEATLDARGIDGVLGDAFVRIVAKVQQYVDTSLELRHTHGARYGGLPPTEVDARLQPTGFRTTAIDQQRQLYAAAHAALTDPLYCTRVMDDLVEWHDAFVQHFVTQTTDGPIVAGVVEFAPDGTLVAQLPERFAHRRLTYAIQGSAVLVRALGAAAAGSGTKRAAYDRKAREIGDLVLAIGEAFHRDFADSTVHGRYFLFERGMVPNGEPPELDGLSHNNAQTYLIKGMETLAALDESDTWSGRLERLLRYIRTQRDDRSGLLHEFDFKIGGWDANVVQLASAELSWQAQNGHETVILGHTIAGLWEGPANRAALARQTHEIESLLLDFIATMNRIGGIHVNGLPANAYEVIPDGEPPFKALPWPEGAWQAELLWQFLLRALEAGIDLSRHQVRAGLTTISLDRVLARGLELHDARMFDGTFYVAENGQDVTRVGRRFASPINHAADTIEALGRTLVTRA